MRAFETRYLIDLLVGTIENSENPRSDISSLKSHILESDKEIVELERLTEIARATERLFDAGNVLIFVNAKWSNGGMEKHDYRIETLEEILENFK